MIFQQLVQPSLSVGVDHKNTLNAPGSGSDCPPVTAAQTEMLEPPQIAKVARSGVVGVCQEAEHSVSQRSLRIAVKAKGRIFFMEIAEIIAIHAECNYASLKYRSSTYLLRESLRSIEIKLRPYGFVQIHRSVLVNSSLVEEVWPVSTGEYRLRVRNGKEYVVTRRYKENLRYLAYVWLGSEGFAGSAPAIEG
jgi:DNA-binding LytR/AlgR family response regulator